MKKIFLIITIFFLLLPKNTFAEKTPGPNASSPGNLSLTIVASDAPDFIKEWVTTEPKQAPTIKRIFHTKPEQLIVFAFIVSGVSGDKENKYRFSVNFYLLAPDQKPLFGQRDYAKGTGSLPDRPMLMMADPALDIVLEESDPAGIYTVVAQVTDLVTGKKADSFYKIELVK